MSDLQTCYQFHRQLGNKPAVALANARQDVAKGKNRYRRYPSSYGKPVSAYGESAMRWVENADCLMRMVGFADELVRMRHKGWYADDCCDETIRGVVYQLPTRNGKLQFAYGYADPINDGAAFLSFDLLDDKESAAEAADGIAEREAEQQRDYNTAWQAGRQYDDLGDNVKAMRAECLDLIGEAKGLRDTLCATTAVKQTIVQRIASYVRDIRSARRKRAELIEAFGAQAGFVE